jgi:hypothetical protein
MADRKYRHQGYQSQDAGPRRPSPSLPDGPRRPSPSPPDGPRSGGMLAKRTVSRCGACGAVLPVATASLEQCPHCRADLHACRQCAHFDPGRRFECGQPIPERVADKNVRNECVSFSLRVTVERDASPDSTRPGDIRRGFDNLFKN